MMDINQKQIKKLFDYRDGKLYWKNPNSQRVSVGDEAGWLNKQLNRVQIHVLGKARYAHRLIFLYHHGYMPTRIDHIDNDPLNNKIDNLRPCTQQQNRYNSRKGKRNKSGVKGVSWCEDRKKWVVQLYVNGTNKNFGRYYDFKVAEFVADTMRHKYHGQFFNKG